MADPTVSFAADIRPALLPYRDQMIWRLDLGDYDDVKANAQIIYGQIAGQGMPPEPFPTYPADFIAKFQAWTAQGCPP